MRQLCGPGGWSWERVLAGEVEEELEHERESPGPLSNTEVSSMEKLDWPVLDRYG